VVVSLSKDRRSKYNHEQARKRVGDLIDYNPDHICAYAIVAVTDNNRVTVMSSDTHDACIMAILIDGLAVLNDAIRNRETELSDKTPL
jgi:hypothetical protein